MTNSGHVLEAFIEQIEKILLPQGIAVTVREKIYNDEGIQIAEFDIELEGRIGSTNFKWLIECRDRPSEGSAPGSWIEQLVGRRRRFSFNKVIAVSTTGFAPGAIEFAEESGIEIRTVTASNLDQIKDWFLMETFTLRFNRRNLHSVTLLVDKGEPEEIQEALSHLLIQHDPHDAILLSTETHERISVPDAFRNVISSIGGLYDSLIPDDGGKQVCLRVGYPRDDSHFVVETDLGTVRITEILFQGEIHVTEEKVPVAAVRRYENISSGEEVATVANFNFEIEGKSLDISFSKLAATGETYISLQASEPVAE